MVISLQLGSVVVLTSDETARLRAGLPIGDRVLECLSERSRGSLGADALADLYSDIDVRLRDAVDEVWYSRADRSSEPPAYELIELAKGRVSDGYPWLLDYIFGPCDGCGRENGRYRTTTVGEPHCR